MLIIDQFEELLTTYPDRGGTDRVSRTARRSDGSHPNLWVVLTLREDYVGGLEPYFHLTPNRLRARFFMQHMGIERRGRPSTPRGQRKTPLCG